MAQAMTLDRSNQDEAVEIDPTPAPAVGLFGYSIVNGEHQTFRPMAGYIRELEQMPNFSPPTVNAFTASYVASHIGKNEGTS